MQISINTILQATSPITRYSFDELIPLPDEGEQLLEPVTGELTVERASAHLLRITGDFQTRLRFLCHRCAEPFEAPAAFNLEEALEIVHEPITSLEVDDRVNANGHLDATDLIRQTLLLSLPPRHLCGCEPSISDADVKAPSGDPRWAALKSFPPENSNGKH